MAAREPSEPLQQSSAIFEELYEHAPDALIVVDEAGRIERANTQAEVLFGLARERLLGQPVEMLLPERFRGRHSTYRAGYTKNPRTRPMGTGLPLFARRADDSEFPVDIMLSPVEIGHRQLVMAAVRDITERKRLEDELRKSEERFKTAVLRSPMPVLVYDDQEQILAVNQSWLQQSGHSRDELRIQDWTTRAYGERSGEVLAYLREIIATDAEARRKELTVRTKDGLERHWRFVASALGTQSDGRRLFIAMAEDTTERKAYEDRIEMLMREARHRTKNILSLVQVVARQTAAREPEPERFAESFSEHIQALAANQDLLVKNRYQGADIEDLVRVQLAHFSDMVGSRIAMRGPKLRLNAAAAQAVGLAVHELATNAGKYGALSTHGGQVEVDWRSDADNFEMSWREHGGPPVLSPSHRGFGSTVIGAMTKRAVRGEVELDYAPSGFGWHLICPAANALEAAGGHGN